MPARKSVRDKERAASMASMYRQGLTLAQIGDAFGVTRERVRQILRISGVSRADGGKHRVSSAKEEARRARLDAKALARFGIVWAAVRAARKDGTLRAFEEQRRNARYRDIDWGLTFAQWLDVWLASGKLAERGRGKGKYVMSRIKDTGGYVIGNVHIQPAEKNSSDAVALWRGQKKANRGVFHLYPGAKNPWLAKVGKVRLGYFETEGDAVSARLAYMQSNGYALSKDGLARKAA